MMRDGMERGAVPERARALIDFWFGPPGDADRENHRQIWFKSTPEHDDRLRDLFLADFERAAAGALEAWEAGPESALALLLLLDQIPRNIFRATARAYATDPAALVVADRWPRACLTIATPTPSAAETGGTDGPISTSSNASAASRTATRSSAGSRRRRRSHS